MSLLNDLLSSVPGSPFAFRIAQAELNEEVNTYIADYTDYPARDITIALNEGSASIGATVQLLGAQVRVLAVGRPRLENGRVDFELDKLVINGRPAPSAVRWVVVRGVRRLLDPNNMPVAVELVEIRPGELQIAGRVVRAMAVRSRKL